MMLCLALPRYAEAQDAIHLKGTWKFSTGDNASWSQPSFNDTAWKSIKVPSDWESQGYVGYNGHAWYRKTVVFPSVIKENISDAYSYLVFDLGQIDDVDEVYLNGNLIGATGNFSEKNGADYATPRKYKFSADLVNWDAENCIAVRVMDYGGGGGIYKGNLVIRLANWMDYTSMEANFLNTDNFVYYNNSNCQFSYQLNTTSTETLTGKLFYQIKTDKEAEVKSGEEGFVLTKTAPLSSLVNFSVNTPGFYRLHIKLAPNGKKDTLSITQNFGFKPNEINAGNSKPADFDAFWAQAKEELATVNPMYTLTLAKPWCTNLVDVYELKMKSLGNVTVGGWVSVPKNKTSKLPAIIKNVGYSGDNMPIQDRPGFIALSFNIRGHGNSKDNFNPGFPGFLTYGLESAANFVYRGAYMDCIRAVDYICSREDVDTSRIAVYGGSQGGALSFITAALDSRVDLCAPYIPFLSDYRNYFEIAPWPANEYYNYAAQQNIDMEQVYGVLDYFDVRNHATNIRVPVFMGCGLQDMVCPPFINFAAFNNVPVANKQFFICKDCGHNMPAEYYQRELAWMKKTLWDGMIVFGQGGQQNSCCVALKMYASAL
ncbi:MAG: prolyl oligopeptidase family serine peptidase [Bacteroidales bacterium]|nr:prolyl oligopeptidase family serine peptidase [Bacteroidales bacterium]